MAPAMRAGALLLAVLLAAALAAPQAQELAAGDDDKSSTLTPDPQSTTGSSSTTIPTTQATPAPTTPATAPTAPATPASTTASPATAAPTAPPAASSTAAPAPGPTALNIFFVNDLRYRLLPTTTADSEVLCQTDIKDCFGGLVGLNGLRTSSPESDVWLHAGAAMWESTAAYEDYYLQLKHATAVDALSLLKFDGMSVDADMFRFGKGREVVSNLSKLNPKDVLSCANCGKGLTEAALSTYRRFKPTGSSCEVVVIGVLNRRKAHAYLPRAEVTDEVEAVKAAVSKAKADNSAAALYVVVGEMDAATVDKVLALEGVSVVLSSGTVADGTSAVSKISAAKDKVSSTLPAQLARAMNVGQLALTLDDKCAPTNVQAATAKSYHATKNDAATATEATDIVTKALGVIKDKAMNAKSAVALSADLDPCGFISCAVGKMAADGVHALVNAPDQATAAVIIPAGSFGGTLPSAFNWTDLLSITPNDPYICKKNLTTEQLYGLLDDMLGTGPTFPQVSGLLVDQYPAEDGLRIVNVWTRTPGLAMRPVPRGTTANVTVAMPCLALEGSRRVDGVQAADATAVTLSQGLERSLLQPAAGGDRVLVLPPQVEQRVRLYIADLSRVDCEDWVGMTVTYTLLVIGSVIMLAYQGYQLWRFRTTLTYIR